MTLCRHLDRSCLAPAPARPGTGAGHGGFSFPGMPVFTPASALRSEGERLLTPVTMPQSAANSLPHPPSAKAPRNYSIPQERLKSVFAAPKTPRLDALLVEAGKQWQSSQDCASEFKTLAAALDARAEAEEWSQREFGQHTGIPFRTWRRLLSGKADLAAWLPKVRAVAVRLKSNQRTGV